MKETTIQQSVVKFLREELPASYKFFSIPNGGRRDRITGAILKREGALAGAPDLQIVGPDGFCVFIEIKNEKGRLSEAQKVFRDWCGENRVPYAICRNKSDVQNVLMDWNIPLKTRAAA